MTYYVTMTDKFMSGWGKAEGKTNKLVLECDTYDEALIVEQNAKRRDEMIYINIRHTKPYYSHKHGILVSWHDKTDYPNWKAKDNLNKIFDDIIMDYKVR